MKKYILIFASIVVLFAVNAIGQVSVQEDWNRYSGDKTADALIYEKKAVIKQIFIYTDGTSCSVALYDNTSASGDIAFPALPCIGTNGGCTTSMNVFVGKGIYADMTLVGGTTCTYNVHFKEQ